MPEVPRTKHIGDKGANVNVESAKMYHDMRFATRNPGTEHSSFGDLFYLMQEVRWLDTRLLRSSRDADRAIHVLHSQAYERLIQDVVSGAVRVAGPSFLTPALQNRPEGAALLIAYERRVRASLMQHPRRVRHAQLRSSRWGLVCVCVCRSGNAWLRELACRQDRLVPRTRVPPSSPSKACP